MQFSEARKRADQILDDERFDPTARYSPYLTTVVQSAYALAPEMKALERSRPREVFPNNSLRIRFQSMNYDLLLALLGHVDEGSKPSLFATIIARINDEGAFARAERPLNYPHWNPFVSELPLVAELCLRQGKKEALFQSISQAEASPAALILLLQLEDSLAFNFALFSTQELDALEEAIKAFEMRSEKHPRRNFIGDHKWKNGQHSNLERFWRELDQVCKSVKQECRKAQYLYLKGELLQGANFEVNQDKNTVIGYLQSLAFSPTLVASLEKAEELYRSAASAFDLKSSMGHLRSFLENLHIDAAKLVHSKVSTTAPLPAKWGEAILFLKQQSVLTQKEEEMIGAFYTVVSDKAIHPLVAEREYARLMRNIAIECGLLVLSNLEKAGYKSP